LALSRSTAYYQPKGESEENLAVMRAIDELYMERPTRGSRMMKDALEDRGINVGRHRIRRLMRLMGLSAIYPKKRTSVPFKGHKIYPYLLRTLEVTRPGQVYATDITYIPMAKGFVYLVAVIDWHSRKVLSHRISNTLDVDFCVEALREAIDVHGAPEIFNTDQGSQFTSEAFTNVLKEHGVKISMDGKGRWLDNVFVERLWWSAGVRGGLPARLPECGRSQDLDHQPLRLLQPTTASQLPWPTDARHRILHPQTADPSSMTNPRDYT